MEGGGQVRWDVHTGHLEHLELGWRHGGMPASPGPETDQRNANVMPVFVAM